MERVIEVIMKMMAHQVVALDKTVAAPRGPKAVWLPMPPNAAAMSPLFPLCSSTTMMRNRQTAMWTIVIKMTMSLTIPSGTIVRGKIGAMVRKGRFELLHHVDKHVTY